MPLIHMKNMCLDSAMDNYPTYELLKTPKISSFIDLNNKCGCPKTIPDTIRNDSNGNPLCSADLLLLPNSYDKSSCYLMWHCPFGKKHTTKCLFSCSSIKYRRVIKTRPDLDIRLYTNVPRGTDVYKKIYGQRTATEWINK